MYKCILVAIDGSVTSDLALREAIGLAKDQNATLRLVHVVDVTPPVYTTTETASAVALHFPLAEYQKALQEAGEKLLTTRATVPDLRLLAGHRVNNDETFSRRRSRWRQAAFLALRHHTSAASSPS